MQMSKWTIWAISAFCMPLQMISFLILSTAAHITNYREPSHWLGAHGYHYSREQIGWYHLKDYWKLFQTNQVMFLGCQRQISTSLGFSTKKHRLCCFFVEFDKNPSKTKHQEKFFHKNDIYKTHWLILEVRNIKITSNLCSTRSTKLVFDSIKKSLSEIKI